MLVRCVLLFYNHWPMLPVSFYRVKFLCYAVGTSPSWKGEIKLTETLWLNYFNEEIERWYELGNKWSFCKNSAKRFYSHFFPCLFRKQGGKHHNKGEIMVKKVSGGSKNSSFSSVHHVSKLPGKHLENKPKLSDFKKRTFNYQYY